MGACSSKANAAEAVLIAEGQADLDRALAEKKAREEAEEQEFRVREAERRVAAAAHEEEEKGAKAAEAAAAQEENENNAVRLGELQNTHESVAAVYVQPPAAAQ